MTNPMSGGLLDIVGQLIGGAISQGSAAPQQPSTAGDVLGQILGGALGGGSAAPQQPSTAGDVLGQILSGALGGGAQQPSMPGAGANPTDIGGMMGSVGGGPMTQMLLTALGPSLAQYVADTFGIDKATAMKVLMIAIPLLLAALARNAQNRRGADSLHSALERDHDGSAVNNMNEIFANPNAAKGGKIVKKVLGNRTDAVAQTLTEQTGLDGGKLLATLAPIVLGVLGQQQREQSLDPNGLAGALLQERNSLQSSSGDLMGTLIQMIGSQPRALA